MASTALSAPEVGCSWRILSILLVSATTPSICFWPNFLTSAANGWSRALRNASTACLSAASSSRGCRRLASLSASLASSTISFEPLVKCLRATHASSLIEPAPNLESRRSFAASQVVSASSPARILLPVAPIRSWHQVIFCFISFYFTKLEPLFQL